MRVRTPGAATTRACKDPGVHSTLRARGPLHTARPARVRVRTPGLPGVPYTHAAAAAQPLTWPVRFKPGSRARCGKANSNTSGFFPDSRKYYCETQTHIIDLQSKYGELESHGMGWSRAG